ncbi:MAG: dynamin family protein [Candidatus Cloacimonadaceae bacterium]|nr:dynamin family protein [Candidatus Cloacimonadaceae bacterium]
MNTDILFSYEKIEDLIQEFSFSFPRELIRHPVTAEYASRIESLHLLETLKSPFTIAFIGQMRSGKSTLLNSIIGSDLAPVGINETTATINWFRYSKNADIKIFRVYWQDGSISDHPLHEISKWIGSQENITRTKWIDFYSNSELLKITSIVDTPGTRSTIQEHEDATLGFLLEEQTLMHGGSADAIVYVINPSMRTDDKEILNLFGSKTRLPGASAYNSIATLQKWEHFDGRAWEKAKERAKKFEVELVGKVSCVVPTSGLLASVLAANTGDVWQELLDYINSKSLDMIEEDLFTQDDFPVINLKQRINWLVLPLCCRYAKHKSINKVNDLLFELLELSGVSLLTDLLTKHFISKAKIIKLGTAVNKAAEVGAEVKIKIDQELNRQKALTRDASIALTTISSDIRLSKVKQYVDETRQIIDTNTLVLESMLRKVDDTLYFSKLCFDFFESDIICLKLMESENEEFDINDKRQLQHLFGISGSSIERRLNCDLNSSNEQLGKTAYQLHKEYHIKKHMYGNKIYGHAINVCSKIIQNLESI